MKTKIRALYFELFGLIFVLLGGIWQANITDWWNQQLINWQEIIQEDVNITLLNNNIDLANLFVEDSQNDQYRIIQDIKKRSTDTMVKMINERQKLFDVINEGQVKIFSYIRFGIISIGAVFFIIGKFLMIYSFYHEKHINIS